MQIGSTEISGLSVGNSAATKAYLGATEVWSSAFNPLTLAPDLWLDASDAATLYDATTGGSLVAADGTVARWEDKSGNARHATQATSISRPLRKTAVQNSLAVLRFDGSNDFLTTVAFGGSQTFERHIVMSERSAAGQTKIIAAHGGGFDTPNPGADYMLSISRQVQGSHNGGAGTTNLSQRQTNVFITQNTFFSLAQHASGTHASHGLRVNGASAIAGSPFTSNPGTFSKAATAYGIGAYNSGALPLNGDIAEFIHFNRVLTTDERTALELYLSQKWGIS